ncbi:hypothetical protein AB2C74_34065, partial [Pseudomonas aeruginosa]
SFAPHAEEKTIAALHSQKDSIVGIQDADPLMIYCNSVSDSGTGERVSGGRGSVEQLRRRNRRFTKVP